MAQLTIRTLGTARDTFVKRVQKTVATWMSLYRQRHDLSMLDDHLRRDVGLTEQQVDTEAKRAFWDVPSNWRR